MEHDLTPMVYISKPCDEDWDKMNPNERGAHCAVCCKTVVDFSNKSPQEIKNYFTSHQGEKTCGRFRADQVRAEELSKQAPVSRTPDQRMRWFVYALVLFFSSSLCKVVYAQSKNELLMGKTKMIETPAPASNLNQLNINNPYSNKEDGFMKGDVAFRPEENNAVTVPQQLGQQVGLTPPEMSTKFATLGTDASNVLTDIVSPKVMGQMTILEPEVISNVLVDSVTKKLPELFDPPMMMQGEAIAFITDSEFTPVPTVDTSVQRVDTAVIDKHPEYMVLGGAMYIEPQFINPVIIDTLITVQDTVTLPEKDPQTRPVDVPSTLMIYPNPATNFATLKYDLKKSGTVSIMLFDLEGQLLRTIGSSKQQDAGAYTEMIDLHDLPSGNYLITLNLGEETKSTKLIITR